MPQVRLNHICHAAGCDGLPGDVLDLTDERAQWLLDRKGGVLLDAAGNPVRPAAPAVETSDDEDDEEALTDEDGQRPAAGNSNQAAAADSDTTDAAAKRPRRRGKT